jgi:hypothetical protein
LVAFTVNLCEHVLGYDVGLVFFMGSIRKLYLVLTGVEKWIGMCATNWFAVQAVPVTV